MFNFFQPRTTDFFTSFFVGFMMGCNLAHRENREGMSFKDVLFPFMFFYAMFRYGGTMEQRLNQSVATVLGMAAGLFLMSSAINFFNVAPEDSKPLLPWTFKKQN